MLLFSIQRLMDGWEIIIAIILVRRQQKSYQTVKVLQFAKLAGDIAALYLFIP